MTAAVARLTLPEGAPIGAPSATAIGRAIMLLEAARAPSRALDAAIYRALGWQVERVEGLSWRACGPLAATWQRLPNPTEDVRQAAHLVPTGWARGSSWSPRKGSHGWCRDEDAPLTFFEINGRSQALALATAGLYGQRELLLRAERAPVPALRAPNTFECHCGWCGPASALRAGRCPDCTRLPQPILGGTG